jgi:hypothetical protein
MTLNQILKSINSIGVNHYQIHHTFIGEEWDFATSGVVNTPAMIVVLQPSNLQGSAIIHSFKIYVGDLVQKDLSNKFEVLSDCQQIALDIIYQLQAPQYEWILQPNITLNDFEDSFDCELYGYWFEIKLKIASPFNICAIPTV